MDTPIIQRDLTKQAPQIRQHYDESARGQRLSHKTIIRFAAVAPRTAIKENHHLRVWHSFFGKINIQLLARVGAVGNVRGAHIAPVRNCGVE